jgi:IS1 family transposase
MNTLPLDKKLTILAAMIEGNSIRGTERMTGVHRDTIMRLVTRTGEECARFLDTTVRGIRAEKVQADEIWTYVFKKQARILGSEALEVGDQYVFVGIDADTKLVIFYLVGKRDARSTYYFMRDLRARVVTRIQLTTDGFKPYINAVEDNFGADVDFAQLVKVYGQPPQGMSGRGWYAAGTFVAAIPTPRMGRPAASAISTSYVERQNLTMRMQMRRFTRLTNAFSKKLENLKAATALHFAHYNFVRVHQTLRITPAMAAGLTEHVWTLGELVWINRRDTPFESFWRNRGDMNTPSDTPAFIACFVVIFAGPNVLMGHLSTVCQSGWRGTRSVCLKSPIYRLRARGDCHSALIRNHIRQDGPQNPPAFLSKLNLCRLRTGVEESHHKKTRKHFPSISLNRETPLVSYKMSAVNTCCNRVGIFSDRGKLFVFERFTKRQGCPHKIKGQ